MAESGTLKSGWQQLKFGDVVRQVKDKVDPDTARLGRYIAGEHMDTDDLRIRRWGEIGANYLGPAFQMRFKPGQVLYGSRRTYLRKVAIPHFEGICANTTFVLESKDPKILLPELLPFIMQTDRFNEHSVKQSKGSVNPYVNFSDLAWFEFVLPPLEDQKELVILLKAAKELHECFQDAHQAAWQVRLAAYIEITRKGFNVGEMKQSPLGEIPQTWLIAPLAKVVRIQNHFRKPINSEERAKIQGQHPYFGPTGKLDSLNEYRLDGTYALIGEDGDHFLKYSVWSMTQLIQGKFNVNNHAHVIQGTEACSTEWFFYYFRHRHIHQWLTKQGSGRLKLRKANLEQMLIALPPPTEQKELVEYLSEITRQTDEVLAGRVSQANQQLQNLRETLLEGSCV